MFRMDTPPPHEALHSLQGDQSLSKQPTGRGRGQRREETCVKTFQSHIFFVFLPVMHFLIPGHIGRSQLSVSVVTAQEGPPSFSWQRRVLVFWPRPQEVEQALHGLQGWYTGQGSLVHTSVPLSHTLRTEAEIKNKKKKKTDSHSKSFFSPGVAVHSELLLRDELQRPVA